MNKISYYIILLIVYFALPFKIFAEEVSQFTKLFKEEQYQEAIDSLGLIDEQALSAGKKFYLIGLGHSRLKKYELAIEYFKKAIKADDHSIDIHYEYGQALYANNNLRLALNEFLKSAKQNYNYTASMYYAAYTSELLEDFVMAKFYYKKLIKDKRTNEKFQQISLYQYSKILLKMMKKQEETLKYVKKNLLHLDINLENYIPRYIIPLLKKAININRTSEISIEIEHFMNALIEEFKLNPNIMANGRKISENRLYASLTQRLKLDDNVASTSKASAINETEGFIKHEFVFKKKMIITPELRFTYAKYKNQTDPDIYKNDSTTISTALRGKYEHVYRERPASFLLDLDYSSVNKDWEISHQRKKFSTTYSITTGEQIYLINSGETYFKTRYSSYEDKIKITNNRVLGISADQYFFLREGLHLMITSIDLAQLDYYEYKAISNNTYLMRFIYLIFEVLPSYTLQTIFSATITDTKEQKVMRGYELTLNPSIDISKAMTDQLRLSINYNFIQNSSKSSDYRYRKQIVGVELGYTF